MGVCGECVGWVPWCASSGWMASGGSEVYDGSVWFIEEVGLDWVKMGCGRASSSKKRGGLFASSILHTAIHLHVLFATGIGT